MVRARLRKKYSGPSHLWQMERIKEEASLRKKYGYKNKKELWKISSILRNFRAQARKLIPLTSDQANLERTQLMNRLIGLGLIKEDSGIEDVLGLQIEDLMARRLQTLVLKKNLANSIKQARQFITHGHISINSTKMTSPSMMVKLEDESTISFAGSSAISNEMHPERVAGATKREKLARGAVEEKKPEKKKEEKAEDVVEPIVEDEKEIVEGEA